jgi:hypothetical protein
MRALGGVEANEQIDGGTSKEKGSLFDAQIVTQLTCLGLALPSRRRLSNASMLSPLSWLSAYCLHSTIDGDPKHLAVGVNFLPVLL